MSTYAGYPFLPAKNFRVGREARPNVIVVHTIEAPQTGHTAQDVADYFHTQTGAPTSAHGIVDDGQLIRLVRDEDTAYAAGTHGNLIGLHLEHAGYARFDNNPATALHSSTWDTPYTRDMLVRSAAQIAAWCKKWDIRPVRIGPQDLLAGRSGICGHIDITHAWPHDTTHWDPGPDWPWTLHLELISEALHGPVPKPVPPVPVPLPPVPPTEEAMLHVFYTTPAAQAANVDGQYLVSPKGILGLTRGAATSSTTKLDAVPVLDCDDLQWKRLTALYGAPAL